MGTVNDTKILNALIKRFIEFNICPSDINLKDRAEEFGEDACKKKYCTACWKDSLKELNK